MSSGSWLQRGRARAGAEWNFPLQLINPALEASTGPRPRGRGMTSLVTLSSAGPQQLNCDCLRPLHYPSAHAVWRSHYYLLEIKRLRLASAGRVFRIISPLAG
ncbi:MAG TPA: hypothetical protein VGO67_00890 [Verrucomicrobiae bacterium]